MCWCNGSSSARLEASVKAQWRQTFKSSLRWVLLVEQSTHADNQSQTQAIRNRHDAKPKQVTLRIQIWLQLINRAKENQGAWLQVQVDTSIQRNKLKGKATTMKKTEGEYAKSCKLDSKQIK